ncbi:uncharacterized protein K460DRAFT_409405 [Cucurbitaria berberidis CBS 394.84]|uniref:Uncharacterized protein n=1 Tax=Cucurbitaria berberidis CBS 394.84 TaxID=1168544 RepID=A0A9P4GAF5_9PLEO|nr:uncharacterized protein K460DRAFT_409405 [Cucurbitaria berberidis CBS 394.84]KAF1841966.1 hypothetical protein K460DRAFT_409405 [Cucurbitaria berberidis CBS 394.84]
MLNSNRSSQIARAPHATTNATHKSLHIDSGYISDVLEEPSTILHIVPIDSSPPVHGLEIKTVPFADTNWDFPASELAESPTLHLSLERIEDLSTPAKQPTCFPIVPLASTLARAESSRTRRSQEHIEGLSTPVKRLKGFPIVPLASTLARARDGDNDPAGSDVSLAASALVKAPRTLKQTEARVADRYGRTRAARRMYTSTDAAKPTSVAKAKNNKRSKRSGAKPSII